MTASTNIPSLKLLKFAPFLLPLVSLLYRKSVPALKKVVMGIPFSGPVGVAAGIDKRGEFTDAIACYSPSFVEIGPLRDVMPAIGNLQKRSSGIVVLANLSNNKTIERSFSLIYDFVDGIVLNVSSGSSVSRIIDHLLELRRYNDTYKPIIFKLFPDLSPAELDEIAAYMLGSGIDGIMVGAEFVEMIREKTQGLLPVIAIAEVSSPERAAQMLDGGTSLVAVTNSPLHYGPTFIKRILKYLEKR